MIPKDEVFQPLNWLTKITSCVALWNHSRIGNPNKKQCTTLRKLKLNGLYHVNIKSNEEVDKND